MNLCAIMYVTIMIMFMQNDFMHDYVNDQEHEMLIEQVNNVMPMTILGFSNRLV